MSEPKLRNHWIDHLKAFGIFLVVYGHSFSLDWGINQWIYSFHMPLFFLISGYLIREQELALGWWAFTKKTLSSLLPAYVIFVAVCYVVWLFVLRHFGADAGDAIPWYRPLLAALWGTGTLDSFSVFPIVLWFFPCLIVSRFLLYLFHRAPGFGFPIVSSVVCVAGLFWPSDRVLPWELETALVAQFFLMIGFFAKSRSIVESRSKTVRIVLGACLLAAGSIGAFVNGDVEMRTSVYSNGLLFLGNAIAISFGLCLLASLLPGSRLSRFLSRETILIFPLHPIVFSVLFGIYVFVFRQDLSIRENPWLAFFSSILITLGIPVFAPIVRRFCPWVYGLRPKA